MLLGQLPGQGWAGSTTAALPSYATAIGHFLDRFGPYRLQPYALPPIPDFSLYQPPPVPLPPPMQPPRRRARQQPWAWQFPAGFDRGGHGAGRGLRGGPAGRSGGRGGGWPETAST
ncbi:MAG: hypothetical protein BroJett029_00130 [Alphaproteobacteria bacterium]|nr:MAG: hypothetical protein BroJett029_00130 [Alphaproteobacteria bacterium]